MRENSALEKICICVDNFTNDLEYEVEPLKIKRIKKVSKKYRELSTDESIGDPIKKFRIETYKYAFLCKTC